MWVDRQDGGNKGAVNNEFWSFTRRLFHSIPWASPSYLSFETSATNLTAQHSPTNTCQATEGIEMIEGWEHRPGQFLWETSGCLYDGIPLSLWYLQVHVCDLTSQLLQPIPIQEFSTLQLVILQLLPSIASQTDQIPPSVRHHLERTSREF